MSAEADSKEDLRKLCAQMHLSVPRARKHEDFVKVVNKFRQGRQQNVEKHWKLLCSRDSGAVASALPSCWWKISSELSSQYQRMSRHELEVEVEARRLSNSTLDQHSMGRQEHGTNQKQLRKRLRESDEAFDRYFPKEGLQSMDAKRLRKLASDLGVHQGDQAKDILIENLEKLAYQRQLRTGHATACDTS